MSRDASEAWERGVDSLYGPEELGFLRVPPIEMSGRESPTQGAEETAPAGPHTRTPTPPTKSATAPPTHKHSRSSSSSAMGGVDQLLFRWDGETYENGTDSPTLGTGGALSGSETGSLTPRASSVVPEEGMSPHTGSVVSEEGMSPHTGSVVSEEGMSDDEASGSRSAPRRLRRRLGEALSKFTSSLSGSSTPQSSQMSRSVTSPQ